MSSTQIFSHIFTVGGSKNVVDYFNYTSSYFEVNSSSTLSGDFLFRALTSSQGTSEKYTVLNSTGMNELFPNNTAKPISGYMYGTIRRASGFSGTATLRGLLGNDEIFTASQSSCRSDATGQGNFSASQLSSLSRSSTIQFGHSANSKSTDTVNNALTISLSFTRYDFSAVAGDNVTSASVSSSTGYDGDTITYTANYSGTFTGWYNGSTLVSTANPYTYTVNGTDLTLTAQASAPTTKTLSATYNGVQLSTFPISVSADVSITYGGVTKATIPFSGGTKTLTCSGKVATSNIGIGSKTLTCSGKLMKTNIVCTIS